MKKILVRVLLTGILSVLTGDHAVARTCVDYDRHIHTRGVLGDLDSARRVALWGDHACIAGRWSGLHLVDIADADAPSLVGSVALGPAFDVAVRGNAAYVAGGWHGLLAVDLTTLDAPPLPAVSDSSWSAESLAVAGDRAYVVVPEHATLQMYDLTDPLAPGLIADVPVDGWPTDVAAADDLVFVATGDQGLIVYRHDLQQGLVLVGASVPFLAAEVFAQDGLAYVSGYSGAVRIIDVSSPSNPTIIHELENDRYLFDLAAGPDRLYLFSLVPQELRVYDTTDPTAPLLLGAASGIFQNFISGVARDEVVYAISGTSWLQVIDLHHETSPPLRDQLAIPYPVDRLEAGTDCLVTQEQVSHAIQVFDVSDPTVLAPAGTLAQGWLSDLAVEGRVALIVANPNRVVDLADLQAPAEVATFTTEAQRATMDAGIAYFADSEHPGIAIWDLRDPAGPVLLADVENAQRYAWLLAAGGFLYLVNVSGQLEVYDVTDPALPVRRSVTDDVGVPQGGAVRDGRLCLASGASIRMVDASEPAAPIVYPWWYAGGWSGQLAFLGDRICKAGNGGAVIVDVTVPAQPRAVARIPVDDAATYWVAADDQAFFLAGEGFLWSGWPPCADGVPVADRLPKPALALTAAPNPFNPRVSLRLTLPGTGPADVVVYDLAGRRLATLHRGLAGARLDLTWDGRHDDGRAASTGVYLVRAVAGGEAVSCKIALVR